MKVEKVPFINIMHPWFTHCDKVLESLIFLYILNAGKYSSRMKQLGNHICITPWKILTASWHTRTPKSQNISGKMKNFHRPAVLPQRRGRNLYHLKSKGNPEGEGQEKRSPDTLQRCLAASIKLGSTFPGLPSYFIEPQTFDFWQSFLFSHERCDDHNMCNSSRGPKLGSHSATEHSSKLCAIAVHPTQGSAWSFDGSSLTWVSLLARSHCLAQCPGAGCSIHSI